MVRPDQYTIVMGSIYSDITLDNTTYRLDADSMALADKTDTIIDPFCG